ncbi:MAG: methyltransferase domain-containing protein [Planctomycetes bacterium]|nr:methyltransferase domain-containing protein [Planctomycetota bacterium]
MNQQGKPDSDTRLVSDRFPRSAKYHPDWLIGSAMGSNTLWLTEWLTEVVDLKPGMRVLDLGCGRVVSSIFLAREFDVQVWATDLWISASENTQRINDAGLSDCVFPFHCDARALPFAREFFDAIVVIDSFSYYGTDDLYLNYLANFVKPGGQIGIAGAGLIDEFESPPEHLIEMWSEDFWCLHSAAWWKRHWGRTKIVDVEVADTMEDGWKRWVEWHETAHPDNKEEIEGVKADEGRCLGYIRAVGRRSDDATLQDYCWPDNMRSFPEAYTQFPLLREQS